MPTLLLPQLTDEEFVTLLLTQEFGVKHRDGAVGAHIRNIEQKLGVRSNGNGNGHTADPPALPAHTPSRSVRSMPDGYDTITVRQATPDELMSEKHKTERAIEFIAEHGQATAAEVAAAIGITPAHANSMLGKLVRQGRLTGTGNYRRPPGKPGGGSKEYTLGNGEPIVSTEPHSGGGPKSSPLTPNGLTGNDLRVLLDSYCEGRDLMDADTDVLERVLRVRRAIGVDE